MYFSQSEHGVPHFHAVYGEFNGVFAIETLEMIEGDLPARSQHLVKEWGNWENGDYSVVQAESKEHAIEVRLDGRRKLRTLGELLVIACSRRAISPGNSPKVLSLS
jgi:hypothetical protein